MKRIVYTLLICLSFIGFGEEKITSLPGTGAEKFYGKDVIASFITTNSHQRIFRTKNLVYTKITDTLLIGTVAVTVKTVNSPNKLTHDLTGIVKDLGVENPDKKETLKYSTEICVIGSFKDFDEYGIMPLTNMSIFEVLIKQEHATLDIARDAFTGVIYYLEKDDLNPVWKLKNNKTGKIDVFPLFILKKI